MDLGSIDQLVHHIFFVRGTLTFFGNPAEAQSLRGFLFRVHCTNLYGFVSRHRQVLSEAEKHFATGTCQRSVQVLTDIR